MKELPLLFSAPMVRALLDGSKVQTRRVIKLPPAPNSLGEWQASTIGGQNGGFTAAGQEVPLQAVIWHTRTGKTIGCPHGQPGDRIWVRETWRSTGDGGRADHMAPRDMRPHQVWYDADGAAPESECTGKTRTSIHMPRWACRILLEIVSVRVERLQDISNADIVAEGIDMEALAESQDRYDIVCKGSGASGRATERSAWRDLWESTGGDWDANPWCWAITFKRVTP